MGCRGIRGAITVSANNRKSILTATAKLLSEMVKANQVSIDDVVSIFFTTTLDLDAEFPAAATRELGWPADLPLLCGHEMKIAGDLPRCLRVLILVNCEKEPEQIAQVCLGKAKRLNSHTSLSTGGAT